MEIEKQIDEAKSRMRDWWQDSTSLGRPVVLCNRAILGNKPKPWEYFRYARMIINLFGNDALKPQLRKVEDAPYKNIPPLPKAPTDFTIDLKIPEHADIIAQAKVQTEAIITETPYGDRIPILRSQAGAVFLLVV